MSRKQPKLNPPTHFRVAPVAALLGCLFVAGGPIAAQSTPEAGEGPNAVEQLRLEQSRLAEKYRALEQMLIRMAAFDTANNPQRAALLKRAAQQSSTRLIRSQLDSVTTHLVPPAQLQRAIDEQQSVLKDMQDLLALLLTENREDRLKQERERIRNYIKEVERLIRLEKSLKGETEAGDDAQGLADKQGRIADRAGKLADQIREDEGLSDPDSQSGDKEPSASPEEPDSAKSPQEGQPNEGQPNEGQPNEGQPNEGQPNEGQPNEGQPNEGQPSEGQPSEGQPSEGQPSEGQPSEGQPSEGQPSEGQPSEGQPSEGQPGQGESGEQQQNAPPPTGQDAAQQRIQAAQQRMQDAQQKLDEAKREEAIEQQEAARRELELAKAELERILRQLREEEVERVLASLEERFRRMLEAELKIYEATQRLDGLPSDERNREMEIQASKLSFQQGKLVLEADKALAVLRDEGSSVAFPESVQQMRDDMESVAAWLAELKFGTLTQTTEESIIDSLQEMIAALQQAQEDLENQQQQQMPNQPPGQPGERPLVDQLAELKMIRALQVRVNKRTDDCAQLLDDSEDAVGQTENRDVRDVLSILAKRQDRIHTVTRDIVIGKNR